MSKKDLLLDEIMGTIEEENVEPSNLKNEGLQQVAELAKRQLNLLGTTFEGEQITKVPSQSAIGDLMKWAKEQGVGSIDPELFNKDLSISDLAGMILYRIQELRTLSEVTIPELMASLGGMSEFKLASGFVVKVQPDLTAAIKKGSEDDAADWLSSKGFGDIVKDELSITLGKEDKKMAIEFKNLATILGIPISEKIGVHWSTLKALVKEQQGRGVEFPEECFQIYNYNKTEIKPAGKKK